MSGIFEYVQHPHVEDRRAAGPPTVAAAVAKMHGPGPIGRLNAKIGLKITVVVGTMWCAYLFTIIALVSAPSAFKTGNSLIIVAWIAQSPLGKQRLVGSVADPLIRERLEHLHALSTVVLDAPPGSA